MKGHRVEEEKKKFLVSKNAAENPTKATHTMEKRKRRQNERKRREKRKRKVENETQKY